MNYELQIGSETRSAFLRFFPEIYYIYWEARSFFARIADYRGWNFNPRILESRQVIILKKIVKTLDHAV
jgi:hypothetical protein